jgi:dolichol-phosphate mannosyltransferase
MDGRPTARPGLSLVIPAYNEEAVIGRAVAEADQALVALGCPYEILVVDDGSRDGTAEAVARAAAGRPAVRLLRHPDNRGYGAALRTGFEAARGDRIAFTDADCQFHLTDLARLLPLTDHHPLAVGYRVDRQDPPHRRFYSWGYNQLVRTLLGTRVRDCDCALKVFRRGALANLLPESSGFFVNAEMLTRARQLGYAVAEAGVRHRPRCAGASKVSLLDVPRVLRTLLPFWWSRVLLPGRGTGPGGAAARRTDWGLGLLLVVAALLFFSRLRCPLLEPDEARYAEIPRQMLAEGRLVVPVLHGEPYYQKPPLLYWLVMASYTAMGVHDWAARLVPCTAGFLVVILTFLWGRRAVGPRAALAGALVLCLSARFVYLGRMLTMDGLLCLWVVASWAAAHAACRTGALAWRCWLVSAAACGLGLLTKGPVALALAVVPLAAYTALDRRAARPGLWAWLVYGALAAGVAGPWYVAAAVCDAGLTVDFFWRHNVLRYIRPLDHAEPVWYYLPGLFLGMLPWTLLLPPLVQSLGRRSRIAAARRPAALGFFLLAFLWCLLFFSLAGCKRPGYILPAMPPLALALGCHLDGVLPRSLMRAARASLEARVRLPHRAALLVLGLAAGLSMLATWAGLQKPAAGLTATVLAAAALAYLIRRGPDRRVAVSWAVCGLATFAVLFTGINQVLPSYSRKFSLRAQVRPQRGLGADPRVPVVCYPHRWDSVSYYLGRNDVRVYAAGTQGQLITDLRRQPTTLVFLKTEHAKDLTGGLPASLEFVPLGSRGLITAGVVCQRDEAPSSLIARR